MPAILVLTSPCLSDNIVRINPGLSSLALPEGQSEQPELVSLLHKDVKVLCKVRHGGGVVHKEDFSHQVSRRPAGGQVVEG